MGLAAPASVGADILVSIGSGAPTGVVDGYVLLLFRHAVWLCREVEQSAV